MQNELLSEVAGLLGCHEGDIVEVIERAAGRLQRQRYYIYVRPPQQQGQAPAETEGPPRSIPAFPSPDDALTFAQYSGAPTPPRVRPAHTTHLLLRLLQSRRLASIVFLEEPVQRRSFRAQPGAVEIARRELLEALGVSVS